VKQHEYGLAEAEQDLNTALHILTYSPMTHMQPEEWIHLATLVGEAALVINREREQDPSVLRPLLEDVVAAFRAETDDFRDVEFQRSARAVRRRYRDLYLIP